LVVALFSACFLFSTLASAQSLTTCAITGTVTDQSGAVVPNATVTATNIATGATRVVTTSAVGSYEITLLPPSSYRVKVEAKGFRVTDRGPIAVAISQAAIVNITLEVGSPTQTVEVSAGAPLVTTNASIDTTFSRSEVQELPSAGGDLTNIAETAPGTVMNSLGGYGNFTTYGLPGTSNLFTVNGENDMDPYFNINNSGASNLTVGGNEIQEATITSNAYAGQYGQLAGAQVAMITKSGSNVFHGNAQWWWNGRSMNANDWMSNNAGSPLPFSNANQWAASTGGPIHKDSTFFFVDTEGLRFLLPNVWSVTAPTASFAQAVVANVTNLRPNEAATYTKLFQLYASAPGASTGTNIPNTSYCKGLSLPGFTPAPVGTQYCAQTFRGSGSLLGSEWILAARVDQKIGKSDNMYFRYKLDHGLQPTYIDHISPNFDALSNQPAYDTQLNETHVFGPRATNSFMATASHYVAQFQQNEALALSTFPYQIIDSGAVNFSGFGDQVDFPQGRNITQYQFIDDFTWVRGEHNLKFGINFRRYDVSDHNFFFNNPGVYFGYVTAGLQNYVNGLAYQYRRSLNVASDVPVAMWGMGLYAQDEWRATSHLTLTLGLRAERNSNPVCQTNCFANFVSPWASLPSYQAGANAGTIAYNKDIASGLHSAFSGVDAAVWAPRLGFRWSPRGDNTLAISGGYGIFYDNPAAGLVDDELADPPVAVALRVRPSAGTPAFDTTSAGSAATWAASANAFASGFSSGQTYSQISTTLKSLGVVFAAPAFTALTGTIHAPLWEEWNFQVQKQFGTATVFSVNYVGNQGFRIPYSNAWPNAYDLYQIYCSGACTTGLIPLSPPVPNYGTVTTVQSGGTSSYNGMTIMLRERFSNWLTAHFNYTYSHNLDQGSNGGIFSIGDSILGQICPYGQRACNGGNSDYDIRHLFTADYVVNPEFHVSSNLAKQALNGWQWSAKIFWRTGLPFSVGDSNLSGAIGNGGGTFMAMPINGALGQFRCGRQNATATANPAVPGCLNASAFIDTGAASWTNYTSFPQQARNQYHGPGFFDTDMSLFKNFTIYERLKLGIGATAFNVFNHPNFGNPNAGLLEGSTQFGQIGGMVGVPTSPYGSFLGFDSAPRVVQLSVKLEF
jgi:hypothetical protein